MKRFIKAAWHTFNAPPSRGYFTTENMHLFENIHSALEELRRLGEYKIVYWNCKSVRAFHNGEIDFNYIPKKPDEFYIDQLYLHVEQDPESDGLIAYYRFRAAKFVQTPVEKKFFGKDFEKNTNSIGGLSAFQAYLLRDMSLERSGTLVYLSLGTPFEAIETMRALKKLRRI
jgi:hypothetical protein